MMNLSDGEVTDEIIATIGFGSDMYSPEKVDMNKERLPDGGYTPKGMSALLKKPFDKAFATRERVNLVVSQADAFLNDGNKQSGLTSMVAFQKLIDDGAVVRKGDLEISAEGNSALDRIQLTLDKIAVGGIATVTQTNEMKAAAELFAQSGLSQAKAFIDPYLEEASRRGYRMLDIGVPQSSYNILFDKIKTAEDDNKVNTDLQQKAKSYGMNVNEYLTSTAKKHNMSVEDVAKRLGYTGELGQ